MKQEVKSVLKKTAKIAGVTCLAVGSVALLTSGMALKAICEGGKYLASTVKRIVGENDGSAESGEAREEDFVTEDMPSALEVSSAENI